MKSKYILGLMSLVVFTACGKSMQVTVKNDKATLARPGTDMDGKLMPLSQFDLKAANGIYPFSNTANNAAAENVFRAIGNPAFVVGDSTQAGFVKSSNEVFRAITQVPPAEGIETVDRLELHLRGVRLMAGADAKSPTLSNQILCVLDTKQCSGKLENLTDSEKANLNPAYWVGKTPVSDKFSALGGFQLDRILDDNSQLFVYGAPAPASSTALPAGKVAAPIASELVIDLKDAFHLTNDTVKQWVTDNSTEFAAGSYRKFQFVLGNNLYAQEGELVFVYHKSDKLPKDFAVQAGVLKNGATDVSLGANAASNKPMVATISTSAPVVPPASPVQSASSAPFTEELSAAALGFTDDAVTLNADGIAQIAKLAAVFKEQDSVIGKVVVFGEGKTEEIANQRLLNVYDALLTELKKAGLSGDKLIKGYCDLTKQGAALEITVSGDDKSPLNDAQVIEALTVVNLKLQTALNPPTK